MFVKITYYKSNLEDVMFLDKNAPKSLKINPPKK